MAIPIALLLSLAIVGFTPSISPIIAQEVNYYSPGNLLTGNLNLDDRSDTYGFSIEEDGVYRLSLNSTGDAILRASVSVYTSGSTQTRTYCTSNRTESFTVLPCSYYMGDIYQLEVDFEQVFEDSSSDYSIKIEHINPTIIIEDTEYTLPCDRYTDVPMKFHADGSNNMYEFRFSSVSSENNFYMDVYNSKGLMVFSQTTSPYSSYHPILLQPDEYTIIIDCYEIYPEEFNLQVIGSLVPTITAGNSVDVEFTDGYHSQYFELPIDEGVQYQINLDPLDSSDVGFNIWGLSSNGPTIDVFGPGENESVVDIVFWDGYMAFTDWDLNPDMEFTRSYPRTFSSYSYAEPLRSALVHAYCASDSNATLSVDIASGVQTISLDMPLSFQLDGIEGPFFKLYKLNNFSAMQLYKFHLEHIPDDNFILQPSYRIFTDRSEDQYYLFRIRPLLTEIESEAWDKSYSSYSSMYYDNSFSTNDVYYYSSSASEKWLYVYVPDGYYNDHYLSNVNSGNVQILATAVSPLQASLNEEILVGPAPPDTFSYLIGLEGNSIYQVRVTGTELQSSGIIELWNSSGYRLSQSQSLTHDSDRFSDYYLVEVQSSGQHLLLVSIQGDSHVEVYITLEQSSTNAGFQLPFVLGSIVAASIEGILIGVVIGKLKFGKDTPE